VLTLATRDGLVGVSFIFTTWPRRWKPSAVTTLRLAILKPRARLGAVSEKHACRRAILTTASVAIAARANIGGTADAVASRPETRQGVRERFTSRASSR